MTGGRQTIRRLGRGDEDVVRALAEREPRTELLAGRDDAFVLTEPDNDAANATYRSLGGRPSDAVMWEW